MRFGEIRQLRRATHHTESKVIRRAIRDDDCTCGVQSEAIKRPSRGHQEVITGHQRPSEAIRGGHHTCDIQYPSSESQSQSRSQPQPQSRTCDIQYPSCTSSSMRPEPGPSYALAFPSLRALACATSRALSISISISISISFSISTSTSISYLRHVTRKERTAHDGARRRGAHEHQRPFGKGERPSARVERISMRARRRAIAPALFAARA